jgi:hypothetical protein
MLDGRLDSGFKNRIFRHANGGRKGRWRGVRLIVARRSAAAKAKPVDESSDTASKTGDFALAKGNKSAMGARKVACLTQGFD